MSGAAPQASSRKPPRSPDAKAYAGPSAIQLIEEAVQLLRRSPASDWAWHWAGSVPWVLGCLFFWSYTSWFAPSSGEIAWYALLLVLLFAWMKLCHTVFARRLLARRRGGAAPVFVWRELPGELCTQLRLHALGVLALPLSALLTAPVGYVWTYYQSLCVTRGKPETEKAQAWELARLWPMATHLAMLVLSLLFFVAWINLLGVFVLVPTLANTLFGVDNVFGLSGWAMVNTTFLASTVLCAWLLVDPIVKSYAAVRCFHGLSVSDGEDLRELFLFGRARRVLMGLALGSLLLLSPWSQLQAKGGALVEAPSATSGAAPAPRIEPAELDRAIQETLGSGDFSWRLRPQRGAEAETEESALVSFIKTGFDLLQEIIDSVKAALRRFEQWVDDLFDNDDENEDGKDRDAVARGLTWSRVFTYGLLLLLLGLLVWLCVVVVRQARRNALRRDLARPLSAAEALPDLRDEAVHAAQLPTEGWLALAREKLALGDWRLAFRALYLAQLAQLSGQGLLTLAKHKTNLEYEGELLRRAPQARELLQSFGRRRRDFDAIWYGRAEARSEGLNDWLVELEKGGAT